MSRQKGSEPFRDVPPSTPFTPSSANQQPQQQHHLRPPVISSGPSAQSISSILGSPSRHHSRKATIPFARSSRHKPRRWPLVFRFVKGAIHSTIIVPVLCHALWSVLLVLLDTRVVNLGLPASIVPSLSIVVGLMLVFRNQTSYSRFWEGRNHLTVVITSVRNLTRSFLACTALTAAAAAAAAAASSTSTTAATAASEGEPSAEERNQQQLATLEGLAALKADTQRVVRILVSLLFATKDHLRAEWGADATWYRKRYYDSLHRNDNAKSRSHSGWSKVRWSRSASKTRDHDDETEAGGVRADEADRLVDETASDAAAAATESARRSYTTDGMNAYAEFLPPTFCNFEDRGVGLPLQLMFYVEQYIKRHTDPPPTTTSPAQDHPGAAAANAAAAILRRPLFNAPQASQLHAQLFTLTDAYGRMETIRLTSIPVALLIHQKQVLALFGAVLPFALVDEIRWWTVPIVCLVMFTLYGIDGIGSQLEDPFGFDRNDIPMDAIVEDIKEEVSALLDEWEKVFRVYNKTVRAAPSQNASSSAAAGGDAGNGLRARKLQAPMIYDGEMFLQNPT